METRYTVRQATELTGVKAYVLRYWEDEMDLHIQRNEMGHRYYTGQDIQLFMNIKELKKRGLQLRAIKELLPQISREVSDLTNEKVKLPEDERTGESSDEKTEDKPETEENEKILEFQAILERLIAQEMQSQNEEEERCRSLDLAIRRQQIARREAAAANERRAGRRHKNT